jgi:hypothetical protein
MSLGAKRLSAVALAGEEAQHPTSNPIPPAACSSNVAMTNYPNV